MSTLYSLKIGVMTVVDQSFEAVAFLEEDQQEDLQLAIKYRVEILDSGVIKTVAILPGLDDSHF